MKYDLIKRGLRVIIPYEKAPYDLLIEMPDNFIRVQVKGSSKPTLKQAGNGYSVPTYSFDKMKNRNFHLAAMVAMDIEKVYYTIKPQIWVPTKRMQGGCDKDLLMLLTGKHL